MRPLLIVKGAGVGAVLGAAFGAIIAVLLWIVTYPLRWVADPNGMLILAIDTAIFAFVFGAALLGSCYGAGWGIFPSSESESDAASPEVALIEPSDQ